MIGHSVRPTYSASGKASAAMRNRILTAAALVAIAGCSRAVKQSGVGAPHMGAIVAPRTILLRGDGLAEAKRALARGDEEIAASFVPLLNDATAAYNAK